MSVQLDITVLDCTGNLKKPGKQSRKNDLPYLRLVIVSQAHPALLLKLVYMHTKYTCPGTGMDSSIGTLKNLNICYFIKTNNNKQGPKLVM